ncbi:MAG: hypothetical protein HY875_02970 [Chloroflexi bacterium]|nr:hypothetical protein [Chloroflexota bacterium]
MDPTLTARDAHLVAELTASYGPAVGAFFEEACLAVSRNRPTTTHVVGHLMREVEASIRLVLRPLTASEATRDPADEENNHRGEVATICASLPLRPDDPLPRLWDSLVGRLARYAHRSGQVNPRPVDDKFLALWRDFQLFLRRAVVLQQEHSTRHLTLLDELLAASAPTKHQLRAFTQEMPHGQGSLRYFFERLDHPGWLGPLRAKGYFAQVPEPVRYGDGYRFVPWPAAAYLRKMASIRPSAVGEVLAEVETNGNWAVIDDLVAIALELEGTPAAMFAARLSGWIRAADWLPGFQPELIGKLAAHVAAGGHVDVALDLMSASLAVLPDARTRDASESESRLPVRPRTRMRESYDYPQVLDAASSALARTAGMGWVGLLGDLLSESISHSSAPEREPPDDHSVIWRPAIETHPENLPDHDARDYLTSALRDAATLVVSEDPAQVQAVLDLLWEGRWYVFRRIALHVLAECVIGAPLGIARVTQERTILDLYALRHEAGRALNAAWPSLDNPARAKILDWVEDGPSDEAVDQVKRERWQLRWLLILAAGLDERRAALLEDLKLKHVTPEHPDFVSYTSGVAWVSESPWKSEELSHLSLDEIETLLNDWSPAGGALDESYEGLGRELQAVVIERAAEFVEGSARWAGLRHTYVRSILEGCTEAVRAGANLDWESLLGICSRVLAQPWERSLDHVPFGDDPDWSWARQSAARLVGAGLVAENPIPPELRGLVWDLLSRLAEDKDPLPESEERDRDGGMDSFARSINCVRGVAVHGAINYGAWLHRQGVTSTRSFEPMPELRKLLERRLDPAVDATACVRSILAHHFQKLVWLDKAWAYDHRPEIFRWSAAQRTLSLDVWHAYAGYSGVVEGVADVLVDDYFQALYLLVGHDLPHEAQSTLRHLVVMWLSEKPIGLDVPGRVFNFGDDALSAAFVDAIEEVLGRRAESTVARDAQQTAGLWTSRLDRIDVGDHDHSRELVAWASVFSWVGIPVGQSARLLIRTLDGLLRGVPVSGEASRYDTRQMIARLVECSREHPLLAMQALIRLVELDRDGWLFVLVRSDIRECIEIAARSGEAEAEQEARALANRLVGRGRLEFRDLARA